MVFNKILGNINSLENLEKYHIETIYVDIY